MKRFLLVSTFLLLIISVKAQNNKLNPADIDKIDIKEPVDSSKLQDEDNSAILDATVTEDKSAPKVDPNYKMRRVEKGSEKIKTEKEPMFPGGREAFTNYIGRKLRIPAKSFIEGIVIVRFVIDRDGHLVDPKIIDGSVTEIMEDEIFRVLLASPVWEPGVQNDRPVRVLYTIPITFKK